MDQLNDNRYKLMYLMHITILNKFKIILHIA